MFHNKQKAPIERVVKEDGTVVEYQPIVTFKCIYCGMLATAAELVNEKGMIVLHEQPFCSEFMAMDALTFMTENRKKFQKDIEDGLVAPN